jgi:hypothetical protein
MDYEEKVPFRLSYLIVALFLLIALYMFYIAYQQILKGPIGTKPAPTWFYFVFGSLFLGFTWLMTQFTSLFIRIEQKSVLLSYGLFKVSVDREKIDKVYLDTANPLLTYGGWGFRLGTFHGRPRKALNLPGYQCVVISRTDTRQELVFSTAYPEEVIKLLSPQPSQT